MGYYGTASNSTGIPRNEKHLKKHVGTTSACLDVCFAQTKAAVPLPPSSTGSKNVRVHSQANCSLGLSACSGSSPDPAPKRQRLRRLSVPEFDTESSMGFWRGS